MAGPYCAMLLADMGARVIKVEPPAGDSTRSMSGARGNDSPAFNAVNRGKQGIVLDLNHEKGRAVFTRLARMSDILVENYRPGVMAKLGIDYDTLRTENPRLIYASISGHGQTGPWAAKGGFDLVAQGLSNAEVGERLFISTRTVATHLQHIYRRLELPSRAALIRSILEDSPAAEVTSRGSSNT